jgi:hypothetical protein
MAMPPDQTPRLSPAAAVLAWLWPGLGHISLGERGRGFRIMFGVLFLFVLGLLIGGLDCVDRRNDRLWFYAQSMCGPIALGADVANQALVQRRAADWQMPGGNWRKDDALDADYAAGDPELLESLRRVGLGRVNEMGTLFIALAGLMNLVVILDALYYRPRGMEGAA